MNEAMYNLYKSSRRLIEHCQDTSTNELIEFRDSLLIGIERLDRANPSYLERYHAENENFNYVGE